MSEDIKLPLVSPDPADTLLALLRETAPQVFGESKVDFDRLKAALGEHIEPSAERYGLTWAGKSDSFRNMQTPSVGTLLPMPEESVAWGSTENLIIEGDNLEVLKLLQKPYHGKVKMMYTDPPYNTGNEFITRTTTAKDWTITCAIRGKSATKASNKAPIPRPADVSTLNGSA